MWKFAVLSLALATVLSSVQGNVHDVSALYSLQHAYARGYLFFIFRQWAWSLVMESHASSADAN